MAQRKQADRTFMQWRPQGERLICRGSSIAHRADEKESRSLGDRAGGGAVPAVLIRHAGTGCHRVRLAARGWPEADRVRCVSGAAAGTHEAPDAKKRTDLDMDIDGARIMTAPRDQSTEARRLDREELLAWAERAGHRPAAGPGRGGMRFAFYGRVSTEDHQDPVTSRARQLGQAGALVAGHGRIVAEFFDIGQSRTLAWARRPQAAALVAGLADPDRGWDAVVIGEYERAFYGSQFASMAPLFEHYGIQLWTPEVGGRVNFAAEDHEQTMLALGLQSKREITRTRIRVRTAMAAQTREQGRYLGGQAALRLPARRRRPSSEQGARGVGPAGARPRTCAPCSATSPGCPAPRSPAAQHASARKSRRYQSRRTSSSPSAPLASRTKGMILTSR